MLFDIDALELALEAGVEADRVVFPGTSIVLAVGRFTARSGTRMRLEGAAYDVSIDGTRRYRLDNAPQAIQWRDERGASVLVVERNPTRSSKDAQCRTGKDVQTLDLPPLIGLSLLLVYQDRVLV